MSFNLSHTPHQTQPARFLGQPAGRWLGAFIGLLALLQLALIAVPRADGHLLGSDGIYYFAYLRSALLEGNFNISSEIALYNASLPSVAEVEIQMRDAPHLNYSYAIGTSLLWLPFFIVGHLIVRLLVLTGVHLPLDGYSYFEEAAVCLGSLAYGAMGLWLIYRFLSRRFGEARALTSTLVTVSGGFLVYYLLFEPSMSHACSMFAASWFFTLALREPELNEEVVPGWKLGLATALMVLVRWQNLVFVLACLPVLLFRSPITKAKLLRLLQAGLVALMGFFPQLLFWRINLGTWLTIPQGSHFMDWSHPQLLNILFTLQHGLISWTPLTALSLIGLSLYTRRRQAGALFEGLTLTAAFALMWYVNAAVTADIGGGASFGMRRFDSCGLIFACGLAALLESAARHKLSRWACAGVLGLLLLWNALFMIQYRLHFIDPIQPITAAELVFGKFKMLSQLTDKLKARLQR